MKSNKPSRVITSIKVKGFKSFKDECVINIKPLTILAGSNSSGKSSIFQPVLMMKQTLNEAYDPGALQLNGANVKFSHFDQLITKGSDSSEFQIEIQEIFGTKLEMIYEKKGDSRAGFDIKSMRVTGGPDNLDIFLSLNDKSQRDQDTVINEILKTLPKFFSDFMDAQGSNITPKIFRKRCFFEYSLFDQKKNGDFLTGSFINNLQSAIGEILHLPGLRGNPERNYPLTAIDFAKMNFSGTFEKYVASIISNWKDTNNIKMLKKLKSYLKRLGLATNIDAKYLSDTEIGLYVSRSNSSNEDDIVSIADVGLGLSQTLPILVAMLIAKKGQMVYIEQPEIHLHPKAQYELGSIFADAIKSGINLVIETHSSVLLRSIQTLVAEQIIESDKVALHWFMRHKRTGYSYVKSANLDENGAFGNWPADFDDINLMTEDKYLTAVEKRIFNE